MSYKTACPVCRDPNAEEDAEEVDIGVGVQRFVTGIVCRACGAQTAACPACGVRLIDGAQHHSWCRNMEEEG